METASLYHILEYHRRILDYRCMVQVFKLYSRAHLDRWRPFPWVSPALDYHHMVYVFKLYLRTHLDRRRPSLWPTFRIITAKSQTITAWSKSSSCTRAPTWLLRWRPFLWISPTLDYHCVVYVINALLAHAP